jgi:hypothetical protein
MQICPEMLELDRYKPSRFADSVLYTIACGVNFCFD